MLEISNILNVTLDLCGLDGRNT